ncbi:type II toxin-antitoxin system VapC family toxin [Roseomonas sp. CCTCC AB2023176]|uniref:type II toxin-antitoxin system VapC family toxin n=1 Tax=Roseomonas sp. CCTCC AB2023176 TaxID=3342640 RepID=UPI0035E19FF7
MSFVLDNSVALAWCFADEPTPAVMALLDRVAETGAVAPLIWPLEAMNGLLVAERQKRLDSALRAELVGFLRELPITLDGEMAEQAWGATLSLAQ